MNLLLISAFSKLKNFALTTTIVSSLVFVLPGCGIPQLRRQEVVRDLPVSFNGVTTAENTSQVGIEEFFADPILTNLIGEGLSGNLQLKMLAEDIQIANNEILKRRGMYLPFVNLGAGAGLNKYSTSTLTGSDNQFNLAPGGGHFPQPLPDFMVAAQFSWQVDIWRQLRNSRDAAGLRYLGTAEGRNYVITRLVAEIAENYYALLALDKRMENLDTIIALQEQSFKFSKARFDAARGSQLAVARFQAEVRKNQSERLIVKQEIIEVENRINFLVGRFPQPVERSTEFYNLNLHELRLGVPVELLQNRPDIRQAERVLASSGLDVKVARANFYPKLNINAGVGYESFNPKYLVVSPESLVYSVAGDLVAPLINKNAIKADYMSANAKQLQALYDYQRTILTAFTEVTNRMAMVQNYGSSIEIKKQQLEALELSVESATKLFQNARVEYMDVLFSQRDLLDARSTLINTKRQQLGAIVNTYQALGGGLVRFDAPEGMMVGTIIESAEEPTELPPAPMDKTPAPEDKTPAADDTK